ncbi:hypothetical protein AYI68_g1694, partial [Smittium mucronatum]
MSDNYIQLTASQINNAEELLVSMETELAKLRQQLVDIENSFNILAEEHSKLSTALADKEDETAMLKQIMDAESRLRLEQAIAFEQLKVEAAVKCEQLAVK